MHDNTLPTFRQKTCYILRKKKKKKYEIFFSPEKLWKMPTIYDKKIKTKKGFK